MSGRHYWYQLLKLVPGGVLVLVYIQSGMTTVNGLFILALLALALGVISIFTAIGRGTS